MFAKNLPLNVFQLVGPGKGGQIEVLITWRERILQVCHYPIGKKVSVGSKANINIPSGTLVKNFQLLDSYDGKVYVQLPFEAKNTLLQSDLKHIRLVENSYVLKQNEAVFISFANNIHLAVRFAPLTEKIDPNPTMLFSSAEYTTMLCALILTTLSGLIVSVKTPKPKKQEDSVIRIVDILFEKPAIRVESATLIPVQEEVPEPKKQSRRKIKKTNDQAIVKMTETDTAHAQSQEVDPAKLGLMSVLSTEGIRKKMDQAYNGAGELIGSGETATGSSGFKESKSGLDLGQKLKDIGAGGAGTATVGISQVKINQTGLEKLDAKEEREQTAIVFAGEDDHFSGTIDREAVRKAVRSHLPAIKYCYERQYKKNSNLEGKIVIAWEIHAAGIARDARVVAANSTMNNEIIERCVMSVIESIRFPEPPDGAVVEVIGFPFVFSGIK